MAQLHIFPSLIFYYIQSIVELSDELWNNLIDYRNYRGEMELYRDGEKKEEG